MLCRAFDTEPEGASWQEASMNAVQAAIRSGWLEPTAISDANGLICRGELYRTAFVGAGIPLYDATLYGLDWLSPGENALHIGKEFGLCAENKTVRKSKKTSRNKLTVTLKNFRCSEHTAGGRAVPVY